MENFLLLFFPLLGIALLIRLMATPMKLAWKLLAGFTCGFLCLWLLNLIAGFTGFLFPVNPVTVVISGFLGIPGILLLVLSQLLL